MDQLEWLGRMLHDGKVLLNQSYMAGVTAPQAPQGSRPTRDDRARDNQARDNRARDDRARDNRASSFSPLRD